jgi:hypothetical protein
MTRIGSIALLVVGVLILGGSAQASLYVPVTARAYSLAELMNMPGGLTVGDKLFSDFTFLDATKNGNPPDPSSIMVEGVQVNGDYGLRFVSGWSAVGTQIVDTGITFKVTALDQIIGNTLMMTLGTGAGTGGASIVENAFADAQLGTPAGPTLYVTSSDFFSRLTQSGSFSQPLNIVWISKDIVVNGGGVGTATISEFFQTFQQIPEPATVALLAVGCGFLLCRRRSARRQ